MKNQFRFRYTWKIHENECRQRISATYWVLSTRMWSVIFNGHTRQTQAQRHLVTYWIYILVVADFADLKSVCNMNITDDFMCARVCALVCALVSVSIWMFCVMYEPLFRCGAKYVTKMWWNGMEWSKCAALLILIWDKLSKIDIQTSDMLRPWNVNKYDQTSNCSVPHELYFVMSWTHSNAIIVSFVVIINEAASARREKTNQKHRSVKF